MPAGQTSGSRKLLSFAELSPDKTSFVTSESSRKRRVFLSDHTVRIKSWTTDKRLFLIEQMTVNRPRIRAARTAQKVISQSQYGGSIDDHVCDD